MTEFLKRNGKSAWVWKMVVFKFVLFSLLTLGKGWLSSTKGVNLTHIETQEFSNICIEVFVDWAILMVAFLDQSIAATKQNQKEQEQAAVLPLKLT